ncbi:hypothetical protein JCM5296_003018 [Sporobolomyces johnsonii]
MPSQSPSSKLAGGSRPTFGKGRNKYLAGGCFGPAGEVYCFCETKPRHEPDRRVTRNAGPNAGREFYKCDKCNFFLWYDEAEAKGRRYTTPPPSSAAPSSSPSEGRLPAPPSSLKRPHSYPSRRDVPTEESFDDIDFNSLGVEVDEDIEDADPPSSLPQSQQHWHGPTPSPSPSKKVRFTSFGGAGAGGGGGGDAGPSTPSKGGGAAGASAFESIQNDPDSPFHAIARNLFGTPSSALPATQPEPTDALEALSHGVAALEPLLESVRRDKERDARLQLAGKKKEEALRGAMERLREENENLKRENTGLKERVRGLEGEVGELRTRGPGS